MAADSHLSTKLEILRNILQLLAQIVTVCGLILSLLTSNNNKEIAEKLDPIAKKQDEIQTAVATQSGQLKVLSDGFFDLSGKIFAVETKLNQHIQKGY